MNYEEAIEWINGNRSMWNAHATSGNDTRNAMATCAVEDAAKAEQAYWVLRAHKEGLAKKEDAR